MISLDFRAIREQYITAKYVDRKFATPKPLINKVLSNLTGNNLGFFKEILYYNLGVHKSNSFNENLGLFETISQETTNHRQSINSGLKSVSSHSNLESASLQTSLRASIQNALAASSETQLHDVGEIAIEQQAQTALQEGDLALIMRLMVSGFDINSRINTTYPLHIAVQHVRIVKPLKYYFIFRIILFLSNFYF